MIGFRSFAALLSACSTAGLAQQALPTRHIDVTLSTRLTYDSNVLRGNNATNGGSADDFRLTPTATLDILYPLGRQALFLNGSLGYDFYKENNDLNRERINLRGGTNLQFSRCRSTLEVGYARFQSSFEDVINTSRVKNTEEHRDYSADLACGGPIGLLPSIGYTRNEIDNSDSFRKVSDIRSDTFKAGLGYTRPTFGTLSLYGTYRKGRYPNRAQFIPGASEGINVYSVGLSYERRIGSRLQGDVSVGFSRVDPKLAGVKKFKGLSYSGDVTWTPNDRLRVGVGFSRSAEQSNLYVVSYSIETDFHINAQYALSERFNLHGGASYGRRTFESDLAAGLGTEPNDRTYRANAGVGFTPRKRLTFSVDASHQYRDVPKPFLSYKDTQVSFTTSVRF